MVEGMSMGASGGGVISSPESSIVTSPTNLSYEESKKVNQILSDNKNLNFVKRIINPEKYPVIQNNDNTVSTHLMSWGEIDGKYYVYPTIIDKGGTLVKLDSESAFKHAIRSKEYIEFDNENDAAWFSENYKINNKFN
jgi:hypothetical protein